MEKWHDPHLDDADISLVPIDCGFDPRTHADMVCRVPRTVTGVRYETQGPVENREARVARGSIEQIVTELKAAGYRVEASDE